MAERCPKCGSPIPEERAGICPVCLLAAALEQEPPESTAASKPLPDFGKYRPIGVLGEGGMGIVYLAEQVQPVRRRLALKVLKRSAGRDFLARFESERQALALMDHPHIARFFDAGETPEGLPYLAMEYVPGVPITDYCDRFQINCRDRLGLLQQVCQAVQTAHQKGIIHRDLKPSNILVMSRDGQPVTKVIDFGVAKAINLRLTERTLFTELGVLIGTPEYMSPEQAQADGLDVDTTTDIYSLGVLLYELLVGALPFDSKMLRQAGYDQIRRVIREEEPPRPTTRLQSLGQTVHQIAKRRGSDAPSLLRLVRGDLEWITMKAIEKDRGRRYASASEFSADIDRFLRDEPVVARSPTAGYKIRKFVRRHRLEVAAASAVLAAILAGLVGITYLLFRIQNERDAAQWAEYKATLAAARSEIEGFRSREAIDLLEGCPPRFRGWEWNYLNALADTSRASFATGLRHNTARLGFPSESRLSIAHGGTVQVWNLESHTREVSLGPFGRILAMTRDGSRIIASQSDQDTTVEILEPFSGRRLQVLGGHRTAVRLATFNRDGTRAATASLNGEIRVWRVDDGQLVRAMSGPALQRTQAPTESLVLSADASRLAMITGMSGPLEERPPGALLWDVEAGRRVAMLEHPLCTIQSLSITAQDRILSACTTVRMWDGRSGQLLKTFAPKVGLVANMAVASEDGARVLTSGSFGELQLWDTGEDQPIASIPGAPSGPVAIAFSPGGEYVIGVFPSGRIKVWDAQTAGNRIVRWTPRGYHHLRQTPDGARLVLDGDEGLELLDAKTGRRLAHGPDAGFTAMAVHPQSGLIAGASTDKRISLWTSELGPTGQTLGPASGPIFFLAFDPRRRRIAAGTETGEVEIWDLEQKMRIASTSVEQRVNHLAYTADGGRLAAAVGAYTRVPLTGGALRILDGATGRPMFASSHPKSIRPAFLTLAFSPDGGKILTALFGRPVLYDLEARELARWSEGPAVTATAFTPDGSRALIARSNGVLEVWDPRNSELVAKFYGPQARSLFFSPDGSRLYLGSYREILVYSTELFHPRDPRPAPPPNSRVTLSR